MLSHGIIAKHDSVLEQMQDIIDEELMICQQLLEFLKRKQLASEKSDLDSILTINKKEHVLVLRLKLLQEAQEYCAGSQCNNLVEINAHINDPIQKEHIIRFEKT